jgi:hypothetical protein
MQTSVWVLFVLFCPFASAAFAGTVEPKQIRGIDLSLASQYFREFASACEEDNGALWDTSLYGPVVFVDIESRTAVASQADAERQLTRHEDVFVGKVPSKVKAEWGIITVSSGGLLRNRERKAVYVTVPSDPDARPLEADGWTLELNEGWAVQTSERQGNYVLVEN